LALLGAGPGEVLMTAEPLSNLVELEPKDESPAEKIERDVYRFVQANLSVVGGHDAMAAIMRIDGGDLTRALASKPTRNISIWNIMRLGGHLAVSSPLTAQRLAAAILKPFDLVVSPRTQLTAAERARRHENTLRTLGAAMGVDLVAKSLETP
jgi:hypothetical protein